LDEEKRRIAAARLFVAVPAGPSHCLSMMYPDKSLEDCRQWAARVEAINCSIRDIPPEKIRFHTCHSIDAGPRIHELELKDIIDIILKINAGAYSFEAANPRHEREYHIFEHVKVPEGRILIPGVITRLPTCWSIRS
jgi:5-methyltetrahydropteroyltriglutamate--homocysteine methyltransferase